MVVHTFPDGTTRYFDGSLKLNLDAMRKAVLERGFDNFIAITGTEGVGKSTLATQIAKYLSKNQTLELDQVCLTGEQTGERMQKSVFGDPLIIDEAGRILFSREAMRAANRDFVKMFMEIRQKQLFVIILLPSIFMLDKYVSMWRIRTLIHCYLGKGMERGYFRFYNQKRLRDLVIKGKKDMSYDYVRPNFRGRFGKKLCVDEQAYTAKKADAFKSYGEQAKVPTMLMDEQRRQHLALITWLFRSKVLTWTQMAQGMIEYNAVDHGDARRLAGALRMASKTWLAMQQAGKQADKGQGSGTVVPDYESEGDKNG